MHVERSASVGNRQQLAVVSGTAQFSLLTPEERAVAHPTIDARMAEGVARLRFGSIAPADGHPTVALDDEGMLVEYASDGTARCL